MSCVRFYDAAGATLSTRPDDERANAGKGGGGGGAHFSQQLGTCASAALAYKSDLVGAIIALAKMPLLLTRDSVEEQQVNVLIDTEFQVRHTNSFHKLSHNTFQK